MNERGTHDTFFSQITFYVFQTGFRHVITILCSSSVTFTLYTYKKETQLSYEHQSVLCLQIEEEIGA